MNFNKLYLEVNGKLHDLIARIEDIQEEFDIEIEKEPSKSDYICPEWRIK